MISAGENKRSKFDPGIAHDTSVSTRITASSLRFNTPRRVNFRHNGTTSAKNNTSRP